MSERIACVLPALDAEATVRAVVTGLREALPGAFVIGVDDGSRDRTAEELRASCDEVVVHERNLGKGAALRAGFAVAAARGCGTVLTIDADGQHDPARAPALIAALSAADIAIGARVRGGTPMPLSRRATNFLSSLAVSTAIRRPVSDAQSGYRAIRGTVWRTIQAGGDRYEFETDFLIRAGRAGFRIAAVPVPTIYGGRSHFRLLSDAARVIATIWRGVTRRGEH
jgi:glycosyltransferase involved in cell wall biosynthesis